ncbi:MAG TPA: glycosyltransferase family 4 protein [Nocardioides sp.]|nr:glycosyltransferase family 4 protein [Nocardioides sp.]
MRILQIITQGRGGPVDHAVDVAVELARQGHQSHLLGPAGPRLTGAAAHGVEVHAVEVASKADVRGLRAVHGVVRRVRPDVLHLQDRRAGLLGRGVAAATSTPSAYTLHGVPDQLAGLVPGNLTIAPARPLDRTRYLTVERLLARTPRSTVVVPCEALADYARDRVGVPASRVRVVPNGVDRRWTEAPPRGGSSGSGDPVLQVLWLGLMQPVKRVPDLVAAVDRVAGVRLTLVGDGPQRPRIEAAVAAAAHPERIVLAGYHDDPASFLATADLLALPSAAEACPMVLLQAIAAGLPVIASRVGGVPELVRDGVDGLLYDAADVHQLAAALATLVADPARRLSMGASARARVLDRFGLDHTTAALCEIYQELAS